MKERTLYADPDAHYYLGNSINDLHHYTILDNILLSFGMRPGDKVVEVGAGSGRYTEMLLAHELRVQAIEPDELLAGKLQKRLGDHKLLGLHIAGIRDLRRVAQDAHLVCGFHVLHHLDKENLEILKATIADLWRASRCFKGWFFLEPNPLNILYPLQVMLTRGMRLLEEKGLWRLDYDQLGASTNANSAVLGTVGVFPPRSFVARLPAWIQLLHTTVRKGRSLVRIYTVVGEIAHNGY